MTTTKKRARVERPYKLPKGRALMLRTCDAGLRGHGGFQWPSAGLVEAPDWHDRATCDGGLFGLLWGAGSAACLSYEDTTRRWMVCEVETEAVVDVDREKIKAPRAWVVLVGTREEAVALISAHAPVGTAVVFGTATAGDAGTATAGDAGTATAGVRGTATAGVRGTATAGDAGTATAGDAGTATAGAYGCVAVEWYDCSRGVYRRTVAEVDGVTIKAGVAYRCDASGRLVEAVATGTVTVGA